MGERTYSDGFADGINYVGMLVARKLEAAMQEPRREPSDRRGRITALGNLLMEIAPTIDYRDPNAEPPGARSTQEDSGDE